MKNEIQGIIETLNDLTAPLFPRKVSDWGSDLHGTIGIAVNPFLEQFGLKYHTWFVYGEGDQKLFSFSHDFYQDNRTKSWNKKGKVSNVKWNAIAPFDQGETIADGLKIFEKIKHEKAIEEAKEWVKAAESDLRKAKHYLQSLQKMEI